ncbi:unnamed protein product, partial [Mycena citricolor]
EFGVNNVREHLDLDLPPSLYSWKCVHRFHTSTEVKHATS